MSIIVLALKMIDHVQQALEIYRTLSTGACIDKNLQQLFA